MEVVRGLLADALPIVRAVLDWLAYRADWVAIAIALTSLVVSASAFSRTAADSAARRKAHKRAAVSVARDVLPPLSEFIRNPSSTQANALLHTRELWRELDRVATMAGRKTRRLGQSAARALSAWEEAWRDYNYNPHNEERHLRARRAAGTARDLVAALAEG